MLLYISLKEFLYTTHMIMLNTCLNKLQKAKKKNIAINHNNLINTFLQYARI